ncbi:MAG: hypothetical protein MZW92_39095 [Comamonadaceae bacterium]|nr:hypothetical protein [Comamonadaceae bacterium]
MGQVDSMSRLTSGRRLCIPRTGIIIPYMGTKLIGLSEALFSKTQRRVLGLLFGNPDRSYYTNEVVRSAGAGIGAVQRELATLSAAGLTHHHEDRQSEALPGQSRIAHLRRVARHRVEDLRGGGCIASWRLRRSPIVFRSLSSMDPWRRAPIRRSSDIDVMVISDSLAYPDVVTALAEAEKDLGRAVNPSIYKGDEFRRKIAGDNAFLKRVLEQPKVFLIGSDDGLLESRESGQDRQAQS